MLYDLKSRDTTVPYKRYKFHIGLNISLCVKCLLLMKDYFRANVKASAIVALTRGGGGGGGVRGEKKSSIVKNCIFF